MSSSLLTNVFSAPRLFINLSLKEQELVLRQAESCDLVSTLAVLLDRSDIRQNIGLNSLASKFKAATNVAKAHSNFVCWEVGVLQRLFKKNDKPLILLKGAAYTVAGLPNGRGRLYSDIDLLVHKEQLAETERILKGGLWVAQSMDDYDQLYYRKWMHEIPPLQHVLRRSVLDVHHAILPETCKERPEPSRLFENIVPVDGMDNVFVLSPTDMVLHSMTHLFYEGEFNHGLRDLVDLDFLLRYFTEKDADFWYKLIDRGEILNLRRPLYYGIRYVKRILKTPMPNDVEILTQVAQPKLIPLMDLLFDRALMPNHISCDSWFSGIAKWLLYIRSHYLRMPIYLLIPHLVRKARKGQLSKQNDG